MAFIEAWKAKALQIFLMEVFFFFSWTLGRRRTFKGFWEWIWQVTRLAARLRTTLSLAGAYVPGVRGPGPERNCGRLIFDEWEVNRIAV